MREDEMLGILVGVLLLIYWFVCIGTAIWIGMERGRDNAGLALGVLLGPVGVIVAALVPRSPANEAARWLAVRKAIEVAKAKKKEPVVAERGGLADAGGDDLRGCERDEGAPAHPPAAAEE